MAVNLEGVCVHYVFVYGIGIHIHFNKAAINVLCLRRFCYVCLYRTVLSETSLLMGIKSGQLSHPLTPSILVETEHFLPPDSATSVLIRIGLERSPLTNWTSLLYPADSWS